MDERDDIALLRQFSEQNSEEAFATLVIRHIDKVYSVALRHTGNPHHAEEITQAVFVILARKSRQLSPRVILEGWLYETARLTAVTHIRSEIRRARREQEAQMQSSLNENESTVWTQIAPLLDAALAGLNETDRHAVVLRFFYGKSLKEIGAALGGSDDMARMRISRAMEKLRQFFLKRGVTSTAATIAGAISVNSVHAAPVALAKTVTAVAIAKGAAAGGSILTLTQGAVKLMAWTKTQTAIVSIVVLGAATYSVIQHQALVKLRRQNESLQQQVDQLSPLAAQNQTLPSLLAQAVRSPADARDKLIPPRQRPKSNEVQTAIAVPDQAVPTPTNSSVELQKDSWTNAGFVTPEATLKTRAWAILSGDRQQFAQSIFLTDGARKMIEDQLVQMAATSKDPDAPRLIQQALAEKWGAEEAILMPMMAENANNTYTDYKILSQKSLSADQMIMEVQTDMASAPSKTETLNFQRFGNDWKIVIDEAAVQKK
jgi:RNA polymerase sigma factor (sigma-70 family)